MPEGHWALPVPAKAAGTAQVPELFPCLGESPPEEGLRHSLTFSLPVSKQFGLCPRESVKERGMWRKYGQVWAVLFQSEQKSVTGSSLPWSGTVKLDICLEIRKKKRSSVPWAWDHSGPEKLWEVPLHSVPVTSAYLNTNFCSLFPGFLFLEQSCFHLGPSKPHPP